MNDHGVKGLRDSRATARDTRYSQAIRSRAERMNGKWKSREVRVVRRIASGHFYFMAGFLHRDAAAANAFNGTARARIDARKHVEDFHRAMSGRLEPGSCAVCDMPSVPARSGRPMPG